MDFMAGGWKMKTTEMTFLICTANEEMLHKQKREEIKTNKVDNLNGLINTTEKSGTFA